MKPSQQIAEELARKAAKVAWRFVEPMSDRAEEIITEDTKTILSIIPFVELIEVARVAKKIGGERIEFEGSEHYAVVIEEVDELDNALEKLRATGKVEI